jgi:hypothetical protein
MNIARRAALVAVLACAMVRAGVGCSTASKVSASGPRPEAGLPGTTACQVQGYFDELDGGECPDATCHVAAVDTNGGRLACCTSVASGPGMCLGASAEGGAPGDDGAAGDASDATPVDGETADGSTADAVPTDGTSPEAETDAASDVETDVVDDAPGTD